MSASTQVSKYGVLSDGRPVLAYTLTNTAGLRVTVLDFGATLAAVETPDRSGRIADVALGCDDLAGWTGNTSYFGATVGRFANRIAHGKFTLEGKSYNLATNNEPAGIPCHLHGGKIGFDKKLWAGRVVHKAGAAGAEFSYVSPDGEEGYPGELTVHLTYWWTDTNELQLEFRASTDRTTYVNLTNHAYWNLTGDAHSLITGHELQIDSDAMLPINAGLIPTGVIAPTAGTPFDFAQAQLVGRKLEASDEQLKFGNGYDHCWVLRQNSGSEARRAARVYEPTSGRVIELFTDQPGLQFYSGNFLNGSATGKGGVPHQKRSGFCLEPQKFPDSPNQPQFPSALLRPGETYSHALAYRFSVQ